MPVSRYYPPAGLLTSTRGAVYSGISAGRGKFVAVDKISPAPCVAFSVVKDRLKRTISVDIQSRSLTHTISNALGTYLGPVGSGSPLPDIRTLLDKYDPLKQHLEFLQSQIPDHIEAQEFRLLVEDFLLDAAVFEGLSLEQSDRPYVLSQGQLRDLHEHSVDTGLDVLDDCFRLGTIPFDMSDDDLSALTKRYSQIALSSDLVTPSLSPERWAHPKSFASLHDPVFALGGAEPEPPGSHQSFSDLALRIKGPELESPSPCIFNPPLNQVPTAEDSVDHFFKIESPLRPGPTYERHALDDSAVGLSSDGFTSLTELENPNMFGGFGESAPPRRARASSFHNGMGLIDTALDIPPEADFGQYTTSRSKGALVDGIGMLSWETVSEPVLFGARPSSSLPVPPVPTPAFHGAPSVSLTYGSKMLKEKQSSHLLRQQLGRNLIASLTGLCKTVRGAVGKSEAGSLESTTSSHFTSFMTVWSGGIRAFRQAIDNHPPRGLVEVLDCLVVATAMCTAMESYKDQDDGSMYFE